MKLEKALKDRGVSYVKSKNCIIMFGPFHKFTRVSFADSVRDATKKYVEAPLLLERVIRKVTCDRKNYILRLNMALLNNK